MASTRRLAAILAADVAGYSRLMGADEEGTHERLKAHRRELVDAKIGEHSGHIVKTTGDGILAEFPSVVDAVRCAAELQRAMIDREAGTPEDRRIRFRIGINLGDIIVEDDDIFGDGVNVAARLEALAEPGGLCISRMVHDQIRDKLPFAFEDLGERSIKNIARPVRVYALRQEAVPDRLSPGVAPISETTAAPRMSIVVLPFVNLSNDAEQQYSADAITEDLTTDLSRIPHMFVISRDTAFTYQGKRVDTKQVGRELGVRYVLEGSVRRSGDQIRINAQLIDAETDAHLWAERFDGDMSDLFRLQDEVTSRIAVTLNLELMSAEAARPSHNPDALEYILRARAARATKQPTRELFTEVIGLLEHALVLDPQSADAKSHLSSLLTGRVLDVVSDTPTADIERAKDLCEQALAASPRSPLAHYAMGNVLRAQRRFVEAIPEYETVLALDRNRASAYFALGQCKLLTGSLEETIPLVEHAIRLSPSESQGGVWYALVGRVHLLQSRTDEAVIWLERARNHTPVFCHIRSDLAAAYALNGETERAAVELAEARRLAGDDRYSSIARFRAFTYQGQRPRYAPCTKPTISSAFGWPGWRKNDRIRQGQPHQGISLMSSILTPRPACRLLRALSIQCRKRRSFSRRQSNQSSSDWKPISTPAGFPWRVMTISCFSASRRKRERSSFSSDSGTCLIGDLRIVPAIDQPPIWGGSPRFRQ
jgi:TolB-like protein/class 3 adenylate cyclase/Flp pilus assembly protein TadD